MTIERLEEIMSTRLCACGCGRNVKSPRSHYATMQCSAKVHNAARPKREKKPAIPKDWTKPAVKPKVESGPVTDAVVPEGVGIKVLPSVLPPTLRDYFGVHGAARLATDEWGVA